MKTQSNEKPEVYSVSGKELRIHWNIESAQSDDGVMWSANEALCSTHDTRDVLISTIIRSVYSADAEMATINNQRSYPEKYTEYQSFRALAKQLADTYLGITPESFVPPIVSMRQARLALLQSGMLDQVESAIAAIVDPVQKMAAEIEWEYATTVERNSDFVQTLASQLGLTSDQMDGLFSLADSL